MSTFAIVEDGSRQYRVSVGDKLVIDYRQGLEPEAAVTFDRVLLANGGGTSQIGAPILEGATVTATVIRPELKGEKIDIGTFKRRKDSRRHIGHRQTHTLVRIAGIDVPGLEVLHEEQAEQPPEQEDAPDEIRGSAEQEEQPEGEPAAEGDEAEASQEPTAQG